MSRLGDFLMQEGLLSASDRRLIRRESSSHNGSFARSVLAVGILNEEELSTLLAAKTSFRRALKDILHEVDPDMGQPVPLHILAWLEVLPLSVKDGVLSVAMVDPTDLDAANQVRFFTGLRVRPVIATRSEILRGLRKIGAELPIEGNRLETFIKTHVRSTSEADIPNLASHRNMSQGGNGLGVDFVQKPQGVSPSQPRVLAESLSKSPEPSPEISDAHQPQGTSHVSTEPNAKPERLERLSLGLGALTEMKTDFRAPVRSGHAELTVAVQAAMSILNRSMVKLQLAANIEDALQKFLEAMRKSGLTNGLLVRFQNGAIDVSAHWRDTGFEITASMGLPDEVDHQALALALKVPVTDRPWVDATVALGDRGPGVLGFWAPASSVPDSLFIVEREDGALVCMVSFAGQYDHDGLRQIFYDSLRALNARI